MDWLLKIMDWVFYDRDLCHERVKAFQFNVAFHIEAGIAGIALHSDAMGVKLSRLLRKWRC